MAESSKTKAESICGNEAKKVKMEEDLDVSTAAPPGQANSIQSSKPKIQSRGKNWKTLVAVVQKADGEFRLYDDESDEEEDVKEDDSSEGDSESSEEEELENRAAIEAVKPAEKGAEVSEESSINGLIVLPNAEAKRRFMESIAADAKEFVRRAMLGRAHGFGGGVQIDDTPMNETETAVPLSIFDNLLGSLDKVEQIPNKM